MNYWLLKTEPEVFSWDDQAKKKKGEPWNGVRNHQANNNMKAMKMGDRAFFYHTGDEKQIVGILEIVKEHYPDPTDETGKFGMVDVKALQPVPRPVTLAQIKESGRFKDFQLVTHSRLSVVPVSEAHWRALCAMGGVTP